MTFISLKSILVCANYCIEYYNSAVTGHKPLRLIPLEQCRIFIEDTKEIINEIPPPLEYLNTLQRMRL
jgi:hypothetical protein